MVTTYHTSETVVDTGGQCNLPDHKHKVMKAGTREPLLDDMSKASKPVLQLTSSKLEGRGPEG